ncbi:MAG: RDD family protein [Planctomycetota bacterium]|nr:RDD family protein [Planctomycetota bacterium]
MRFVIFLLIGLLGFGVVFYLTYDYSLVTDLRIARTEEQLLLNVEKMKLANLFSSFSDESDFYQYDPKNNSYRRISFTATNTVGMFETDNGLLLVYPRSYAYYELKQDSIELSGKINYFPNLAETGQEFECSSAVKTDDGIACMGILPKEDGAMLVRLDIDSDGNVSKPQVVVHRDVALANLELSYADERVLAVCTEKKRPTRIHYFFIRPNNEFFGDSVEVVWNGYMPYITDEGAASLLLLREGSIVFDLFDLKQKKVVQKGYLAFEPDMKLVALAWSEDIGFTCDGVRIRYHEKEGNALVAKGSPVKIGKAHLSPELIVVTAQAVMILMLIAFSFLVAMRRGKKLRNRMLHPSGLVVRLAAFAIDGIGVVLVALPVFLLVQYFRDIPFKFHLLTQQDYEVFQNVALAVLIVYGTAFESFLYATPGKLMFAITVVNNRGTRPRFVPIFVRNLMKPVDLLLASILITPLLMLFTPLNQRLGDLLSSTLVVSGDTDSIEDGGSVDIVSLRARFKKDSEENDSDTES